jgi:hypothetical protein
MPTEEARAWQDFCDRMLEAERARAEARREVDRLCAEVEARVGYALRVAEKSKESLGRA